MTSPKQNGEMPSVRWLGTCHRKDNVKRRMTKRAPIQVLFLACVTQSRHALSHYKRKALQNYESHLLGEPGFIVVQQILLLARSHVPGVNRRVRNIAMQSRSSRPVVPQCALLVASNTSLGNWGRRS